jgi:hypothetical protein
MKAAIQEFVNLLTLHRCEVLNLAGRFAHAVDLL